MSRFPVTFQILLLVDKDKVQVTYILNYCIKYEEIPNEIEDHVKFDLFFFLTIYNYEI